MRDTEQVEIDIDWLIKKAKEAAKYKKALRDIVKWNDPVIQDYESYSIAKNALEEDLTK